MDMISLAFVGIVVFCIGLLAMWKFGKRMTPEEKALYDAAYTTARQDAIVDKATTDAKGSVDTGGVGGALQKFAKGFGELQEEGRKLNLPSLTDYDREREDRE